MYYLERNQLLIAEAEAKLEPKRVQSVGSSSAMSFVPMGSYYSSVLEKNIFVGVKEYRYAQDKWQAEVGFLENRMIEELAVIAHIAEHLINLRENLPQLYGLLKGVTGKPVGLFMEDFSQGNKFEVHDHEIPFIHPEIVTLFGEDALLECQINHMSFKVGGRKIRYGDFFNLFIGTLSEKDILVKLPIKQIAENLDKYTLRLRTDF